MSIHLEIECKQENMNWGYKMQLLIYSVKYGCVLEFSANYTLPLITGGIKRKWYPNKFLCLFDQNVCMFIDMSAERRKQLVDKKRIFYFLACDTETFANSVNQNKTPQKVHLAPRL